MGKLKIVFGLLLVVIQGICSFKHHSNPDRCGGVRPRRKDTIEFRRDSGIEQGIWCMWQIVVNKAQSITFTIEWLDLAVHPSGECAHLLGISQGDWQNSGYMVSELCGTAVPAPITVAGGLAFVDLGSFFEGKNSTGFRLRYKANFRDSVVVPRIGDGKRCGDFLQGPSGEIELNRTQVPTGLGCRWMVSSPEAASITFTFESNDLSNRKPMGCNQAVFFAKGRFYNRVLISQHKMVSMYCRSDKKPPPVNIHGDHAFVTMAAFTPGLGTGFKLKWRTEKSPAPVPSTSITENSNSSLCEYPWKTRTYNGVSKCMKFFNRAYTQKGARDKCKEYNATVASGCQQAWLKDMLYLSKGSKYRIWTNLVYTNNTWVHFGQGETGCRFGWEPSRVNRRPIEGSCAVILKNKPFPGVRVKKACRKPAQLVCERVLG